MKIIVAILVIVALAMAGFVAWSQTRERPPMPITGDYQAAVKLAREHDARLILVVDEAPPSL